MPTGAVAMEPCRTHRALQDALAARDVGGNALRNGPQSRCHRRNALTDLLLPTLRMALLAWRLQVRPAAQPCPEAVYARGRCETWNPAA